MHGLDLPSSGWGWCMKYGWLEPGLLTGYLFDLLGDFGERDVPIFVRRCNLETGRCEGIFVCYQTFDTPLYMCHGNTIVYKYITVPPNRGMDIATCLFPQPMPLEQARPRPMNT